MNEAVLPLGIRFLSSPVYLGEGTRVYRLEAVETQSGGSREIFVLALKMKTLSSRWLLDTLPTDHLRTHTRGRI